MDGPVLTDEEESAYRLILGWGASDAVRVAEAMRLGSAEAKRLLDRLRRKGLVSDVAVSEGLVEALSPDVAFAGVLARRQQAMDASRLMVASLSETYRMTNRRRDPRFVVEVVTGAKPLRETLRALQESARHEILWFCRANPLAMAGSENDEERSALERGVRYRAVYERELLEMPGEMDGVAEAMGWGEESRVVPTLPVRLAIIDRTTAVCPLLPDADRGVAEPTAAVIGRGQLLDALIALFESVWETATPLRLSGADGQDDDDPSAVSPGDRALLSMLVAGMPDKSISSLLDISRRTVQRRMLRLMALAGVDSRAALAYQAARRGWL
ncbi:TrmB family transcriptional regulator [Microbacterium lushaniae]|nr:TrmB family transcriptional regulator [Microbacterium lushaniae]KAA9154024.1 TrmB family transcriptional regulator [Microbacterium lushaniae]